MSISSEVQVRLYVLFWLPSAVGSFAWESVCDNIYLTSFRFYLIGCVIDAPGRQSDPERRNSCGPLDGSNPSDRLARDGFGPVTIQPSKAVSIQSQVDKFMAADFSNLVSSDDLYELDVLVLRRITVKLKSAVCLSLCPNCDLDCCLTLPSFFCVCVLCFGIVKMYIILFVVC